MRKKLVTYAVLPLVLVASFGAAYILPSTEIMRGIYATPGLLALFGALFQWVRDTSAHEHNVELQMRQQIFSLGATSHMANVAFDKHVEFCEKYLREVHETVATLYRHGPTDQALVHSNILYRLRLEYSAWLTSDINAKLSPFEQALREMGADQTFIKETSGVEEYSSQRSAQISKVYSDFKKLLTIGSDKEPDPDVAVEVVKTKVREILDIEDLVALRRKLISEAKSEPRT